MALGQIDSATYCSTGVLALALTAGVTNEASDAK